MTPKNNNIYCHQRVPPNSVMERMTPNRDTKVRHQRVATYSDIMNKRFLKNWGHSNSEIKP